MSRSKTTHEYHIVLHRLGRRADAIQNPGFESDFTGYQEEYYSAATARFTIDSSVARSGIKSLKVVNNTPGGPNVYKTLVLSHN